MYETSDESATLQLLLDSSHAGASERLGGIIDDGRTLGATELAGLLTGMHTVAAATVTGTGEPRISALDGHVLHGRWTISTSAASPKARHLQTRPAIRIVRIDGEDFAVFAHGHVEILTAGHPAFDETIEHWTAQYGSSPLSWGGTIVMSVNPTVDGRLRRQPHRATRRARRAGDRPQRRAFVHNRRRTTQAGVSPGFWVTHHQRRQLWPKRPRERPAC